ncbi:hypothetical protein, partial [Aeromonas caviae]|uniref:hypothetical protein n=1 Tax=Aeromonas caviae TaxID=648 RepID=UPI001CC6BE04
QNITMVKQRVSTMFCTTGAEFQFWAKSAILPQNANSPFIKGEKAGQPKYDAANSGIDLYQS